MSDSGRVTSDLLLVGSLPADSSETALRIGAELFGDLTFALPDGETGARASWVPYDRDALLRANPGVELLAETSSPTGVPRNVFETPRFRIREGVTQLELESWPRIDEALASYATFSRLREERLIPAGVRFQVCLPFPSSITNATFKVDFEHDHAIAGPALEDLTIREIGRLLDVIPPADLAIQWDVSYEVNDLEEVVPGRAVTHGSGTRVQSDGWDARCRRRSSWATTSATAPRTDGPCTRRTTPSSS
jgi:hypothetical protein